MAVIQSTYQTQGRLDANCWITDPSIPDPDNIPVPLGWCVLIRPYPVEQNKLKSSLIMPTAEIEHMNYVTNIGRVVSVGPCCWNRAEHKMKDGTQKDWVQVGDFVSFPKNVGQRRKFKGVSYVLLVDDEIVERLPDPQVFDDGFYQVRIPEADLVKYNTYRKQAATEPKPKKVK
jgi:co-chaperonin GroES (HSP10)